MRCRPAVTKKIRTDTWPDMCESDVGIVPERTEAAAHANGVGDAAVEQGDAIGPAVVHLDIRGLDGGAREPHPLDLRLEAGVGHLVGQPPAALGVDRRSRAMVTLAVVFPKQPGDAFESLHLATWLSGDDAT